MTEDAERLIAIAEEVLAGEPIENFELGEIETRLVLAYTWSVVRDMDEVS